ncbi:MAG: ATP-binding protein [Planctomycetota bacterium]
MWSLELDLGGEPLSSTAPEFRPGPGSGDRTEIHPEDRDRLEETLARTVAEGRPLDVEYRVVHGDRVTWLNARADLVVDVTDTPTGLRGAIVDITRLKNHEEDLLQAKKLETVGQLAAGVAHDFNNLLTVIGGYAEMVDAALDESHPLRPKVSQIVRATERAGSLTRQLLAFSRQEPHDPGLLDLNDVLLEIDLMLRRLIGADVRIVTMPGPGLWKISADPARLEQIIVNLAVNARDAMPEGGTLTIRTVNRIQELDDGPDKLVELTVADTGCGMDEEVQRHIFEPFFTTKDAGDGTGLGLATVHSIVRQCRGRISVKSRPGKGTTFTILLPVVSAEALRTGASGFQPSVSGGRETILLIEDEDAVREFAADILRAAGYRVLTAKEGVEGLSAAEACPGRIHLLFTDVVLPLVGGDALAGMMVPNYPGLKVLYSTGYAGRSFQDEGRLDPDVSVVDKPYSGEELLRRVREILDR